MLCTVFGVSQNNILDYDRFRKRSGKTLDFLTGH